MTYMSEDEKVQNILKRNFVWFRTGFSIVKVRFVLNRLS